MTDSSFAPHDMISHANSIAKQLHHEMPDDECVLMVRDFISVLADWQPAVAAQLDDPTMLAITALTTTRLFELAFVQAYGYSAKQVQAREAIKKALGDES